MLVLTRTLNTRVQIILPDGRTGWVVVLDVVGKKVRIGFDLPADVRLAREETLTRPVPCTEARTTEQQVIREAGRE